MTDRIKGCIVVFGCDIRDDDAVLVLDAIRMIRGVASVTTSVRTPDDWMNRERIRRDYQQKVLAIFEEPEERRA